MKYSSTVMYTSGVDSFILLEFVRQMIDSDTKPVYFDIGHKYSKEEKEMIFKSRETVIIDESLKLGDIEEEDAHIPNRNILLATLAASRYSDKVFIGGSLSDRVSDNTKQCFLELSTYLSGINSKKIEITSPFWDVYKDDMVRWYCHNVDNANEKLINYTFSCFSPLESSWDVDILHKDGSSTIYNTKHCFSCSACFRRNAVLASTGYVLPFYNNKITEKYKKEFSKIISLESNNKRAICTLQYINELERLYGSK